MKIVVFSINPLFPYMVTGGASKHLFYITQYLARKGHTVEVYCAQSARKHPPFLWGENIGVFPVLPFNLPFPQPYAISGADLARIVDKLSKALLNADRFYIHDGEMLLPDIYDDIPTISSFRDNVYPELVLGSFIHRADEVICVSDYSAAVIEHTAGRFYPGLSGRMHRIKNGINLNDFSKVENPELIREINIDPEKEIILLHPHRPEPGKGLPETIQVVASLVHEYGLSQIKVIIPEWIDDMVSRQDSQFTNKMMDLISDLRVSEFFKFMPWLPLNCMKELYSIGDVTLCLGNIVEAFGNVAYESLACGTPSVVSRVGVHRTLLPEELISKVHYGDIPGAVDTIRAIINGNYPPPDQVQAFLRSDLNFEQQVKSYAEIIEKCEKRERLKFKPVLKKAADLFMLAPWCYIDGDRIFHDFQGTFSNEPGITELFQMNDVINRSDAALEKVTDKTWNSWLEKTYIVPQIDK